jgi:hypothetical protein
MDGTSAHHVKRSLPDSERQILHVFSHMQNLDPKNDMNINASTFGMRTSKKGGGRKERVMEYE